MIKYLIVFAVWTYPSTSIGGLFSPNSYDECVLESMKGVTSDLAARAIVLSCRSKFPAKAQIDTEVPVSVLEKITGSAGMTNYGYFTGHIHNGTTDWNITQITVEIKLKADSTAKKNTNFFDFTQNPAKEYNVSVSLSPLTDSEINVSAAGWSSNNILWNITRARGYKSK